MDKDNGMLWSCMCSLIEILWVLEEKISLNCWQLQHDVPVTEIFEFNPPVNFLYFLTNWVNLFSIFYYPWEAKSIWKKSKPLKQLFDALETNSLSLMTVLTFFSEIFSIANFRKKFQHSH